ncbi:VOC family protein [Frigoribacterium sp. 2-23]|uniref:VOC family protein n=1 Tax=Frigoribacterium sp. 2-23 TaxID=3415006 RepID=UPI003C70307A
MPRITTVFWFDDRAEEAARFYVGLFPNSRVTNVSRYPDDFPDPAMAGQCLVADFELDGSPFQALNGGSTDFAPNESVSQSVAVETQDELDRLWFALAADGGVEGRCGWVRDRFGFWWQIVPTVMQWTVGGADPEGSARALQTMMGMSRLVIADLQAAYDGA